MLSDMTSDQRDSRQCGHCGAPLAGRFTRCPSCHARAADTLDSLDSLDTRFAPPRSLNVPLHDSSPIVTTPLSARGIWRPASRALVNPYDIAEEPVVALSAYQRLRQPVAISASALVVASAVYLGFIHGDDSSVGTPVVVSGKVTMQAAEAPIAAARPAVVIAQQPAAARAVPVRPPPVSPQVASPPPPPSPPARRVIAAAPAIAAMPPPQRTPSTKTNDQPDKLRTDVSRHLKAARASLEQNNLSATKARLAAAVAAQPANRDALNLRTAVNTREQQRDALLNLARACGYVSRWACMWRNASNALQVDSSSKEAQRLATLAMHESAFENTPPAEPAAEPTPEIRSPSNHH